MAQMGGVRGLIYSALPVAVLVPVNTAFGLVPAISAALGVAALILAWRLFRHDSIQPAVSGFIGVGLSALIAWVVGASKGYFLLGIWSSLVWAAVFAVSVLIRRPIVGYVWSWVNGHDRAWRNARRAVLAFDIATLTWVLVFGSRFLVQRHLYDADQTGWLGVARIADGVAADRGRRAGHLPRDPLGPAGHPQCAGTTRPTSIRRPIRPVTTPFWAPEEN